MRCHSAIHVSNVMYSRILMPERCVYHHNISGKHSYEMIRGCDVNVIIRLNRLRRSRGGAGPIFCPPAYVAPRCSAHACATPSLPPPALPAWPAMAWSVPLQRTCVRTATPTSCPFCIWQTSVPAALVRAQCQGAVPTLHSPPLQRACAAHMLDRC